MSGVYQMGSNSPILPMFRHESENKVQTAPGRGKRQALHPFLTVPTPSIHSPMQPQYIYEDGSDVTVTLPWHTNHPTTATCVQQRSDLEITLSRNCGYGILICERPAQSSMGERETRLCCMACLRLRAPAFVRSSLPPPLSLTARLPATTDAVDFLPLWVKRPNSVFSYFFDDTLSGVSLQSRREMHPSLGQTVLVICSLFSPRPCPYPLSIPPFSLIPLPPTTGSTELLVRERVL